MAAQPRPVSTSGIPSSPSVRPATPSYARATKASLPPTPVTTTFTTPLPSPPSPSHRSSSPFSATTSSHSPYARPPPPSASSNLKPPLSRRQPGQVPGAAPRPIGGPGKKSGAKKATGVKAKLAAAAPSKKMADVSNNKIAALSKPLSPKSSSLSPLAPSFSFRPSIPLPQPAFAPAAIPKDPVPATEGLQIADVSPAPSVAEESPVEDATAPSPSFREMEMEAEDELEDGEIRQQVLPKDHEKEVEEGEIVESNELQSINQESPRKSGFILVAQSQKEELKPLSPRHSGSPSLQAFSKEGYPNNLRLYPAIYPNFDLYFHQSVITRPIFVETLAVPVPAVEAHEAADIASEVVESAASFQAEEENIAEVASEVAEAAAPLQAEEEKSADVASQVAETAAPIQAEYETIAVVASEVAESAISIQELDVTTQAVDSLPEDNSRPSEIKPSLTEGYPNNLNLYPAIYPNFDLYSRQGIISRPAGLEPTPFVEDLPTSAEEALATLNSRTDESVTEPVIDEVEAFIIPPTLSENAIPTSAEEVVAMPSLEESLDVDQVFPAPVIDSPVQEEIIPEAPRQAVKEVVEEPVISASVLTATTVPNTSPPLSSFLAESFTGGPPSPSEPNRFTEDVLKSLRTTPPASRRRRSSSPSPPRTPAPAAPEAPSLTLAIVSTWNTTSWAQRIPAIIASVAINFGLPFINGVMLGFGELFARNYLGVRLGWGTPFTGTDGGRANTSSVGLGAVGRANPLAPGERGSAGARTAAGAAVKEGAVLAGEGLKAAASP
ncbi:hypothetical protein P7C70_g2322, partial [Phenoliferia sp. Uapishka_3]